MRSRLKLQTFPPDGHKMPSKLPEYEEKLRQAWAAGHARGVHDGAEASAREYADAQDQLRAALIESLSDSLQTRIASQNSVVSAIWPIVSSLVRKLAPALAAAGFAIQIREVVETALKSRPKPRPSVHCSPESYEAISQSLSDWDGEFEIVTDYTLTPLEGQVYWNDGFDRVCLDQVVEDINGLLQRLDPNKPQSPYSKDASHHAG